MQRWISVVIAASVVVLILGGVGPSSSSNAEAAAPAPVLAPDFGLTAGCCAPKGVSFLSQAEGYAASGAGWVRMGFDWSSMEPARGAFNWTRDTAVATFTGKGMKVLGVLAYSPQWATDPTCSQSYGNKCAPLNLADFAVFAAAVAERYDADGIADAPGSPRVDAWEIWNEPNLAGFWRPAPEPERYTALLRSAASAIRVAAPGATIVSAGLSPAGGPHAPVEFLRSMYASGAAGSFDALGFHPYSYPHLASKFASWNAWQQMFQAFPAISQPDSLRSLMIANGDGDKQIWATEYGAPTFGDTNRDGASRCDTDGVKLADEDNCVSEERQAAMVAEAYTLWRAYPWSGPLFWYSYQDLASGTASIENNFGLLRTDGTQKPALAVYRSAAEASAPDTTAPDAPTGLVGESRRTTVSLRWAPAVDDRVVTSYRVYRNGVPVATTVVPSFLDPALKKNTSYRYAVTAADAAGNVSSQSAAVTVRTRR